MANDKCERCAGTGMVESYLADVLCDLCGGSGNKADVVEVKLDGRWCRRCNCRSCRAHVDAAIRMNNDVDREVNQIRQERVGPARIDRPSVPQESHLDPLLRPVEEEKKRSQQLTLYAQHLLEIADAVVHGDALVIKESEMHSGDVVCIIFAVETRESLQRTLYHESELWQVLERRGVELMDAAAAVKQGADHRRKRDGQAKDPRKSDWQHAWENTQMAVLRFLNADWEDRNTGGREINEQRRRCRSQLMEITGITQQRNDEFVIEKIASTTECRLVDQRPTSDAFSALCAAVREYLLAESEISLPRPILNSVDRRNAGQQRQRRDDALTNLRIQAGIDS